MLDRVFIVKLILYNIIRLLMLVKRPILVGGEVVIVRFKEDEWEKITEQINDEEIELWK